VCACACVYVLAAGAAIDCRPARAEWLTDVGAGARFDNNVAGAESGTDVHSDLAATAQVTSGPVYALGDDGGTLLALAADLRVEAWSRYGGLSNAALGAQMGLDRKLGLGRGRPHLFADASVSRVQFDNAIRDGWLLSVDGGARLPVGDRIDGHALAGIDWRRGRGGTDLVPGLPADVFDQASRFLRVGGDLRATGQLSLQIDLSARYGDASYTETVEPGDDFDGATAVAHDPVFGPAAFVERVRARSETLRLGAAWMLGAGSSLVASFERQIAHSTAGDLFARSALTLDLVVRFE
jgi:hypothetical protein